MIEPKEVVIKTQAGEERTYVISKFPAVAGREIITKYPVSNIPKIGEYQQSEEVMLKLMAYVGRKMDDGSTLQLMTRALVDNHVPDWETLARIEMQMLGYNTSFFANGVNSGFFASIAQKVAPWISQTLIPSLVASWQTEKPASKT